MSIELLHLLAFSSRRDFTCVAVGSPGRPTLAWRVRRQEPASGQVRSEHRSQITRAAHSTADTAAAQNKPAARALSLSLPRLLQYDSQLSTLPVSAGRRRQLGARAELARCQPAASATSAPFEMAPAGMAGSRYGGQPVARGRRPDPFQWPWA